MPPPNSNPTGCCEMPASCCIEGKAPDTVTATVKGLCGNFTGTLIGQGSGPNANCWTGKVDAQVKDLMNNCVSKTLQLTLCCDPMGNMVLTVACTQNSSSSASFPQPTCDPLNLAYTNFSLPADCNSLLTVEIDIAGTVQG